MTLSSISIVIPAFNEAQRLPPTLARIREFADIRPEIIEVIVVDDGSRDLTSSLVRQAATDWPLLRCVSYPTNGGKGYAVRRGALAARGDLILISDADLSTPISELDSMVTFAEQFDIVIGSRALDRSKVIVHQPWYREAMGRTFNRLVALITGLPFRDTQCGFKLLRRDAARPLFQRATVDGFAWDVEILMLAGRLGFSIKDVPVLWLNSPESRVHVVKDSLRMLRDVLRTRLNIGRIAAAPPVREQGRA